MCLTLRVFLGICFEKGAYIYWYILQDGCEILSFFGLMLIFIYLIYSVPGYDISLIISIFSEAILFHRELPLKDCQTFFEFTS